MTMTEYELDMLVRDRLAEIRMDGEQSSRGWAMTCPLRRAFRRALIHLRRGLRGRPGHSSPGRGSVGRVVRHAEDRDGALTGPRSCRAGGSQFRRGADCPRRAAS